MKQTILGILLIFSVNTFAQKVGIQFYQGINKPMVSFSGAQGELDYQSNYNSDTRIGIFYGDLSKLSVSTLIGVSLVKATAKNDDLTTSFTQSSIRVDIPIRYAIPPVYKRGVPNDFFIRNWLSGKILPKSWKESRELRTFGVGIEGLDGEGSTVNFGSEELGECKLKR